MTTSKKSKRTRTTRSTKTIEQLVYVGPTLSEGRLSFSTVYMNGLPLHVQDIVEAHPWFKQLFVPVSELDMAIKATKDKGSYLNILYNKAKKEV